MSILQKIKISYQRKYSHYYDEYVDVVTVLLQFSQHCLCNKNFKSVVEWRFLFRVPRATCNPWVRASVHICNSIHAENADGLWATTAHCIITATDSRSMVFSHNIAHRQARTHCGFLPWL